MKKKSHILRKWKSKSVEGVSSYVKRDFDSNLVEQLLSCFFSVHCIHKEQCTVDTKSILVCHFQEFDGNTNAPSVRLYSCKHKIHIKIYTCLQLFNSSANSFLYLFHKSNELSITAFAFWGNESHSTRFQTHNNKNRKKKFCRHISGSKFPMFLLNSMNFVPFPRWQYHLNKVNINQKIGKELSESSSVGIQCKQQEAEHF